MNRELLEKARGAKSADEIVSIAKEGGFDIDAEKAAGFFSMLKSGEISEEELENAAGGCGGQSLSIHCYCPFQ